MHKLHSPYMVNFPQKDSVHTMHRSVDPVVIHEISTHMLTMASTRVQEAGCDVVVITSAA